MNEGVRGPCSTHTPSRQPEATRACAGNLAPLRWGLLLGALPRCVQPTLRLGVEEVGLPTWKAGEPVWHNMTDLAPSPWRGFFWRPSPSVGCLVLTKRGRLVRYFGGWISRQRNGCDARRSRKNYR